MRRYTPLACLVALIFANLMTAGCTNHNPVNTRDIAVTIDQYTFDANRPQVFGFTQSLTADSIIFVPPNIQYTEDRGYGFDLATQMNNDAKPFYFSVKVPEGNYKVSIQFGHTDFASNNTVKAESRRLYLQNITTTAGQFVTRSFIVNIRNANLTVPEKNAPGASQVVLNHREQGSLNWDNKLTLEFNGSAPQIASIRLEKVELPTIYLAGDSTVTDQAYEPAASWGQMLPAFFNEQIAIANHAESGETLKSFMTSLRLAKILETLKSGDYVFIQFGHNDQKKQWPQTYADAETTYKDYLRVFISETRLRGATPVLITSVQRRTFDHKGNIQNSHGLYPQAVRELAKEQQVTLIDLDLMSVKFYEALGVDQAPLAFNDNGKDATHHNNYGAYQLAECVVQAIRKSGLALVKQLHYPRSDFDPSHPITPKEFRLIPSPESSSQRPAGN